MSARDKILIALELLLENLLTEIKEVFLDDVRPALKILFLRGFNLYIRYNDFNEYSYQLIFSQDPFDRIRFDNFDDHWDVESRPHHFHPRGEKKGINSPMDGFPKHDIPILLKYIPIK